MRIQERVESNLSWATKIISLLLGLLATAPALAVPYRLDIVAQIGTVIDGHTITEFPVQGDVPVMNDHGEVVFTARVTEPGGYDDFAVLTNRRIVAKIGDVIDGQPITWLADEAINPKINNLGQVAYSAVFGSPECCISSGVYKLVLDNHIAAEPGMLLSGNVIREVPNNFKLDNLGRVLFSANAGDSGGVYSQHGLIIGPGDEIDGHRLRGAGAYAVNPNNELLLGVLLEDAPEQFRDLVALATVDEILLRPGTVLDGNRTIYTINGLWIDADRRVLAQVSTLSHTNEVDIELLLLPGGPLSDEAILGPLAADHQLLSNPIPLPDGELAFIAAPSDPLSRKLFAGDELVAATGDVLGGRVLGGVSIGNVTALGNMALGAEFLDGTRGVLVATAIPEPPMGLLTLLGLGSIGLAWLVRRGGSWRPVAFGAHDSTLRRTRRFAPRAFESLEGRSLLAAFESSEYILYNQNTDIGTALSPIVQTSGAALVPVGAEEHLFTIHNTPDRIREYRLRERNTVELIRTITLGAFFPVGGQPGGDTEGIVYLGPVGGGVQKFAIVEERIGYIDVIDIPAGTIDITINKPATGSGPGWSQIIPATTIIDGGNDGLEGIAFRPNGAGTADDLFYVVKEQFGANRGVWQVQRDAPHTATRLLVCTVATMPPATICPVGTDPFDLVEDLSDIYYVNVGGVHTLFLLSEDGLGGDPGPDPNHILRVELDGTHGRIVETRVLYPDDELRQPEGLTFTANGSDMIVVGEPGDPPTGAPTSQIFHYRLGGDADRDGQVVRDDVLDLTTNYALGSVEPTGSAAWANGDFVGMPVDATDDPNDETGDGIVNVRDLIVLQSHIDSGGCGEELGMCDGGGEFVGGGESLPESGGETSGGEESLLDSMPARFYFTTSGAVLGGGALGSSVPAIALPGPGETVDLYIWVQMGTYDMLRAYAMDVNATTPGVVKAVESEIYRADILDRATRADVDNRWGPNAVRQATLNADGDGGARLVFDTGAAGAFGGIGLIDAYDGTGDRVDSLYDPTNDAFLIQRIRLEGLPGSAGQRTGLEMTIGRLRTVVKDSSITGPFPVYLGLGETPTGARNNQPWGTDGTIHATIAVAAGSPGAVVARVMTIDEAQQVTARLGTTVRRDRAVDVTFNETGALLARDQLTQPDAPQRARRLASRARATDKGMLDASIHMLS